MSDNRSRNFYLFFVTALLTGITGIYYIHQQDGYFQTPVIGRKTPSKEKISAVLDDRLVALQSFELILAYEEREWIVKPFHEGSRWITFNRDSFIDDVVTEITRTRQPLGHFLSGSRPLKPYLTLQDDVISHSLEAISSEMDARLKIKFPDSAQSARVGKHNAYRRYTYRKIYRESDGNERVVDRVALAAVIKDALMALRMKSLKLKIYLPVTEMRAKVSFLDVARANNFNHLLAKYSTRFDSTNIGRSKNLALAASRIDGVIIPAGKRFSFNKIVGPRTRKAGFKDAGVIMRGKIVPGIGGGICQVTSTLYNVALFLDLPIIERYNHSIYTSSTSYVPIGFDAAVVWGYKDFRFSNNTGQPLLFSAQIKGGNEILIECYGEKKLGKKIELFSGEKKVNKQRTIVKRSHSLKRGEKKVVSQGVDGYIVKNFMKVTYADGKSSSKLITTDRYLTYNTLIHKGI